MSNEARTSNDDSNELKVVETNDICPDIEIAMMMFDVNDERNRIENQPKEKNSFDHSTLEYLWDNFQLIHLKGGKIETKESTSKAKRETGKKVSKKDETAEKTVKKVRKVATDKTEKTSTKSKTSTAKKRTNTRTEGRE